MADIREIARGRWPEILNRVGGLAAEFLVVSKTKEGPCPCCGGSTRYRFDDLDGNGTWFCSHCGGRDQKGGGGSGFDLLMRLKGWEFSEAARQVEQFLGVRRDRPAPPTKGASGVWYYNEDFCVIRWEPRSSDGKKEIRPCSWDGSRWQFKRPPGKLPLYNLPDLRARPSAFVVVVEGEKAAEAAKRLFPRFVVTTWHGGDKNFKTADWSPLAGRKVALWPDNDEVGDRVMRRIAFLIDAADVRMVKNPEGVPEKWDLADADWTPDEALAWLKANCYAPEPEDEPAPGDSQMPLAAQEPEALPTQTAETTAGQLQELPFVILGSSKGRYFFLPARCHEVLELTASALTKNNLCQLAPLRFWELTFPGRNGPSWDSAMDWLIDEAQRAGPYDPTRIRGRGAWWDDGQVVLHQGDRLIIDGRVHRGLVVEGSRYIYERAIALPNRHDEEISDDEALRIFCTANEFSWEVPASGALLVGWATLAPFCGALEWRPHIWVTGGAGTGKSSVLKRFVRPLLAGNCHNAQASTTEAGLRSLLGSDAIPVVFDEADPSTDRVTDQMDNLLGFIRAASSDDSGSIIKGRADGGFNRFEARAMFCLASINAPVARKSDRDRFCLLSLRKGDPNRNWDDFEAELVSLITPEQGRRLAARTLRLIPVIRANARTFAAALAGRYSQRFGDQCGTLLAGAYSLLYKTEVSLEDARLWIDAQDWESYGADAGDSDERECLNFLLEQTIAVDPSHRFQVAELALAAMASSETPNEVAQVVTQVQAGNLLGRHGFKAVAYEGEWHLAISNKSNAIDAWLRNTRWSNSHTRALKRIPGAVVGRPLRFGSLSVQRCTLIPISSLL